MDEKEIFTSLGAEGFKKIAARFYQIMKTDNLIGKMYPEDDWDGAEKRLADFLLFRFGGDKTYIMERGHPRLRMRHMPYLIGEKERDRWMEIMDQAMVDTNVPVKEREALHQFFAQVAEFMRNH